MDAEVEDLLAGLSDDSGGNDVEQTAVPSVSLDSQIASEFALVKQIYRHRSPLFDELPLTETELVSIIFAVGNLPSLGLETQRKLIESVGSPITTKLCIAFSETTQKVLSSDDLEKAFESARRLRALLESKQTQISRISSEASSRFPNMSALLEPNTIACLIVQLGGEASLLAVTPASNLINPAKSALADDIVITAVPANYKRQALRILAGKVVLAARLDAQPNPVFNPVASQWRRNVEKRISKLLAPPPALQERALPKPIDKKPKRRGGQRVRIQKQKRLRSIKSEFVKFGELNPTPD